MMAELETALNTTPTKHLQVAWADHLQLQRNYSLMLGALKGLRWQVPDDVRQRIDSVISEVEGETK